MSNFLFYADNLDFELILALLNNDSEIAFIVSDGKRKWIAKNQVSNLDDGRYFLWHIPSGKLPLLRAAKDNILGTRLHKRLNTPGLPLIQAGWINDPFKGWKEPHLCVDCTTPCFNNTTKIVEFIVQSNGIETPKSIGLSAFGWIGNRYRVIGKPATKEMVNWWRRMKRWISKTAIEKIPKWGPINGPNSEIWAFPSAYNKIKGETPRDANPPH